MTIEALLRVLGDAEGPSRTVDSDILLLLSEPHIPIASPLPADDVLLPYTARIAAALTLIPARGRYLIDKRPQGPHGWVSAYRARAWPGAVPEEAEDWWGSTAAIALCRAGLAGMLRWPF